MKQDFEACLRQARLIVKSYRTDAPEGYDPQNYMATSTIIAIVGVVAAIAGAATSAAGAAAQSHAQQQVADYNARVSRNSAVAARQEAEAQANMIRNRAVRLRGAQVAAASKSGVTLSGSVSDVIYDSSVQGEMDALTSIYKGYRGAQAGLAEANLQRFEGSVAGEMGSYGVASAAIGGAGRAADYGVLAYNSNPSRNTAPTISVGGH